MIRPDDPPSKPLLTVLPSRDRSDDKRSKSRPKPQRADRTQREQDLLDLLAAMKRDNRNTANAIHIVTEHIAKSPGHTLTQAICRVLDFANKNRAR
jgi:hypothetical protein